MSSYLHPENAKRVQQIQELVCLESEREAVNLIIALAWQDVLAHLVDKVGLLPPAPALPQPTDNGNATNGHYSNAYTSPDNGYLPMPSHAPNHGQTNGQSHGHPSNYGNGHGYTNGNGNGHSNGNGNGYSNGHGTHHGNGNGYSNGREAQLFTTLRDVEF